MGLERNLKEQGIAARHENLINPAVFQMVPQLFSKNA